MTYELDAEGVVRLEVYFDGIGTRLGEKRRRASFALYVMGILGEHERKSVEPLAAAVADDPESAQRAHDHLLHFIGQSEWEDGPIREFAARHAVHAMGSRERISAWVIDDTGFMKQGRESPGVQRQYTGSVGKVANCQIGVSLTLCTPTEHVPVNMQLYLPEAWTDDRARCDRAKTPRDVRFRPKWQIALEMMETAVKQGLPKGVALADAAYGNIREFRAGLRWLDFEYAVGVNATTVVRRASKACADALPTSVEALACKLPRSALRATTTKERWRTERVYQDLKGELGLDHYEGRSYRGWNHHVTVVLGCYAFVLGERLRHFPPRAEGRVLATRSTTRHERHFEDSFITARLAIARVLVRRLLGVPAAIMPTRLHPQPSDSGSSARTALYIAGPLSGEDLALADPARIDVGVGWGTLAELQVQNSHSYRNRARCPSAAV